MTTPADQVPSAEITLKEVYEKVLHLEGAFDTMGKVNDQVTRKFRFYVYLMSGLIVIDILLSALPLIPWLGKP